MFALFTALTLLLLGGAQADYRLQWRHPPAGDSKRFVAMCDAPGEGGNILGSLFSLVQDRSGCYIDYRGSAAMDKLAPIYRGGFYHYIASCMDSGEGLGPGLRPKVMECVDKKQSQLWVIRSNGLVELGCSGFCLDVKDGVDKIQLWDCDPGNRNQQFDVVPRP